MALKAGKEKNKKKAVNRIQMHPFTASTSLFAHPGILYSLWTADMQTKSQQSMPFGATWSNPIIWGRSRATSGVRKRRKEWGSCPPRVPGTGRVWRGEMGGDAPKMGFVMCLEFGQSLVWALCQVSFSTLDWSMNAFLGAVVTERERLLSLWFSCLCSHAQRGAWMWQQCKEEKGKIGVTPF